MTSLDSNDSLVRALSADLTPVRRLAPPRLRVLFWLAIVCAVGVALAAVSDVEAVVRRLAAAPDLWLAATGSALTAGLSGFAAFQLGVPDRARSWALLPLPALLLWISASGLGCLRSWSVPDTHTASLGESGVCLVFILGLSLPLSLLLIKGVRRGYSLHPNLTLIMGGLACASAAATLLNFIHPYDSALTDLAVHAFAVSVFILMNTLFGSRILTSKKEWIPRNRP